MGRLCLEHETGVGDVLRGRAPVDIAASLAVAQIGQLPHQRDERMAGEVDPFVQRVQVDQLGACHTVISAAGPAGTNPTAAWRGPTRPRSRASSEAGWHR